MTTLREQEKLNGCLLFLWYKTGNGGGGGCGAEVGVGRKGNRRFGSAQLLAYPVPAERRGGRADILI